MRNILCMALIVATTAVNGFAATKKGGELPKAEGYKFTIVKEVPATSVKDQSASGTCWSFAGLAFVESELIRKGKGEFDLSEMWVSRLTYMNKAIKYARLHGSMNLGAGGALADIFTIIDQYGIVPEEAYRGLNYGTTKHNHSELDRVIKAYMDAIVNSPKPQLTNAWKAGLNGILDAYYGPMPEKFTYKGKEYTPLTFAQELGLKGDDYVSISSFTHHPFGKEFMLEIPDNWDWHKSYNVPLDQFMNICDKAIENGMSILWNSDVSENGFSHIKGIAVMPDMEFKDMSDSEKAKWGALTEEDKGNAALRFLDGPMPEIAVTQESRQKDFDNYQTTDDHSMQITGIAKDQNGNKYYKVKNSWSEKTGPYAGYFYASEPFVKAKTINYIVPKELIESLVVK